MVFVDYPRLTLSVLSWNVAVVLDQTCYNNFMLSTKHECLSLSCWEYFNSHWLISIYVSLISKIEAYFKPIAWPSLSFLCFSICKRELILLLIMIKFAGGQLQFLIYFNHYFDSVLTTIIITLLLHHFITTLLRSCVISLLISFFVGWLTTSYNKNSSALFVNIDSLGSYFWSLNSLLLVGACVVYLFFFLRICNIIPIKWKDILQVCNCRFNAFKIG